MLRLTPWPQTEQNFIGRGRERVIGVYHWQAVFLRPQNSVARDSAGSEVGAEGSSKLLANGAIILFGIRSILRARLDPRAWMASRAGRFAVRTAAGIRLGKREKPGMRHAL